MTSQMVNLAILIGQVIFFGIFVFQGVNISKVKSPGKFRVKY